MKKLFFILLSIQFLFASTPKELTSGEAITNTVKQKGKQYYKITVPNNKSVRVNLTELESDVYLYVKKGNEVRFRFNDCYSSRDDSSTQECLLTNDGETSPYSIFIYGTGDSSYKIKATIEKSEEIQILGTKSIEDAVEYKKSKQYQVHVKEGRTIRVKLFDLTADADLRVKFGRKAALNTFDCKSSNGGTKVDECKITTEKDGILYVQVYGYKAANYSLEAKIFHNGLLECMSRNWLEMGINEGADVTDINTTCITDMSNLFAGNKSFNQDISSWDVSNVTNMEGMFKDATSFNQDISKWNVSKVTNMNYMFNNTASFSNHDLSKWNVEKVVTKDHFADNVGDGNRAPKFKKSNFLSKEEQILEKANNAYNANENCESDEIVCADKGDKLIYILDHEHEFEGSPLVKSSLYAVSRTGYIHQVQSTKTWRNINSSLIKLKNTDLIALRIPDELHSLNYTLNIYNKSSRKEIISMHIREYDRPGLNEIKTIDNGSKLIISYWETKEDKDTLYTDTYDINDTTNVKVISKHVIAD